MKVEEGYWIVTRRDLNGLQPKFKICSRIRIIEISSNMILPHRATTFFLPIKNGFTLVETLVALALILAALVGPVSLVTKGLVDFSFSQNKLVAAHLAQEGIELVRLVRDNNILCASEGGLLVWNHDPGEPPGQAISATPREVSIDTDRTVTAPCGIHPDMPFPRLDTDAGTKIRFDSSTGRYGYSGGSETPFVRRMDIITPPLAPTPCPPDPCIPSQDQMDVIATVSWLERDSPHRVVLQERLYNWR